MPNIYELSQEFRRSLLRREATATREILAAYQDLINRLDPLIIELVSEISKSGINSQSDALALRRFQRFREQAGAELNRLSRQTSQITEAAQLAVGKLAATQSNRLIKTLLNEDTGEKLPTKAIEAFVGLAGDGSPLLELFREIAADSSLLVKNKLLEGIALGHGPRKTAAEIRKVFGTPAARALTVARTETLRVYREATRATFEENSDIVRGWIWIANLSPNTCFLCWARHGKFYPLNMPMPAHPNCRCVMVPFVEGMREIESGEDAFAKLEPGVQKDILGRARFDLYNGGKASLPRFVITRTSEKWGEMIAARSLAEIPD